jgi:ketosteroid isomerase-like protein
MDIFELLLRMFFDKDTDKDTKRDEAEIWATLHRHLQSILTGDFATYAETSTEDLSVYEMFLPHRLDGLDLHRFFMIEHRSAGTGEGNQRYDLLEPRLRRYGDTAVVSYTFLLTVVTPGGDPASVPQRNSSPGPPGRSVAGRPRPQVARRLVSGNGINATKPWGESGSSGTRSPKGGCS